MKKVIVGFVGATALAAFSVAMAGEMTNIPASDQPSSNNNDAGFFISGNLGYDKFDFAKPTTAPISQDSITNTGFAWNGNVGYQFNSYFALESGYTQFADVLANSPIPGISSGMLAVENKDNYGIDLLAKGILPINQKFNVFAKAGVMRLHTTQVTSRLGVFPDSSTTLASVRYVPEFGVGASYNLTHNVALTLQGITTLKSNNNIPATYAGYAGLSYKFNA
ncbi:MAG: hypothetical protein A3F11_07190 [Gammaproteobacteria bacterium RIFCSPHIGHO2_12_FULL_37_14]|nr:MAG: hypothetical protein A3F11_07190 [Gammaproteobacteria bacterium RIFCSPHIGHO2_12_FULL_37_14]